MNDMSFSQTVKEDLLKKNNDSEVADKLQIEAMLRFSSEIIIGNPLKGIEINFFIESFNKL